MASRARARKQRTMGTMPFGEAVRRVSSFAK